MSIVAASPEILEGEYEVESSTALAQLNTSEIDMQIATAKKWTRSISTFTKTIKEFATLDEETAGSMFYKLPRGNKVIEGPSVRLAEVAAASYKNLRFGSRIINIGDRMITAQGFCLDLENNIAVAVEVQRSIMTSSKNGQVGKRFDDNMIQVVGMAAQSIALRNAIFKIIPMAFITPALNEAKLTCLGKNKTMAEKREAALTWFKKAGASDAQVFAMLGIAGEEDLGNEDLITLRGLVTAIKEGTTTLEAALAPPDQDPAAGGKVASSSVNDKLKGKPKDTAAESKFADAKPADAKPASDAGQASSPQDQ